MSVSESENEQGRPQLSKPQESEAIADHAATTDSPRAARTRATRARLLEAGLSLFADQGPRAVTSAAIAREAGYASGTFYLHFKDKHALFRELAEDATRELEERLLAVAANKTELADIVHGQADALVGFAEDRRDLLRIVFHPEGEVGDVGARILERLAAGVSARRRERAASGGTDPNFDPDVLAQAVVGMWAHVLAWWAEDPSRAGREDLVRTLTHFQLYGSRHEASDLCGQAPSDSPDCSDFS